MTFVAVGCNSGGGSGGGGTGIAGMLGMSEAGRVRSGGFTETTVVLGIVKDFSAGGAVSFIGVGGGGGTGGPGTGNVPPSTTLGSRSLSLMSSF